MCKLSSNKYRQHGLSLLEVLVAFSVLSISLGVLFKLYAQGPRSAALAAETADAVLLAESKLHDFIHADGNAIGNHGKYQWDITDQAYATGSIANDKVTELQMREYTIQVSWQGERQRQLELGTLRVVDR